MQQKFWEEKQIERTQLNGAKKSQKIEITQRTWLNRKKAKINFWLSTDTCVHRLYTLSITFYLFCILELRADTDDINDKKACPAQSKGNEKPNSSRSHSLLVFSILNVYREYLIKNYPKHTEFAMVNTSLANWIRNVDFTCYCCCPQLSSVHNLLLRLDDFIYLLFFF